MSLDHVILWNYHHIHDLMLSKMLLCVIVYVFKQTRKSPTQFTLIILAFVNSLSLLQEEIQRLGWRQMSWLIDLKIVWGES
jgi:hypothetical protein